MGVGSAFTGLPDDEEDQPTKPIVGGPTREPSAFDMAPSTQAALLQIGLNMMQPPAWGQTTAGHIGQAIGAGGEAATRLADSDTKERLAESKLAIADERLRIAQQNADTRERRGTGRAIGGLTAALKYRMDRDAEKDVKAGTKAEDDRIFDQAKSITDYVKENRLLNPEDPTVKQYGNMPLHKIQESLRAAKAPAAASGSGQYGPPGTKLRQGGKSYTVGADGNPVED